MADPPSYDQDLLVRLNALKKTPISLHKAKATASSSPTSRIITPELDLEDRLRTLRNGPVSSSTTSSTHPGPTKLSPARASPRQETEFSRKANLQDLDIDDLTLNDLLSDLGGGVEEWEFTPEDPVEVRSMLAEARKATEEARTSESKEPLTMSPTEASHSSGAAGAKGQVSTSNEAQSHLSRNLDLTVFAHDEKSDDDGEEDEAGQSDIKRNDQGDEEADEIVRRMLDQVSLEKSYKTDDEQDHSHPRDSSDGEDGSRGFHLPSAPSTIIQSGEANEPELDDFHESIAARLKALQSASFTATDSLDLPSAPTFKPADKSAKYVQKKGFSDEEIECWCVICSDDATVQCIGCDGDLYCANCWKEGHIGPDIGFEEKMHKWRKFVRPR